MEANLLTNPAGIAGIVEFASLALNVVGATSIGAFAMNKLRPGSLAGELLRVVLNVAALNNNANAVGSRSLNRK